MPLQLTGAHKEPIHSQHTTSFFALTKKKSVWALGWLSNRRKRIKERRFLKGDLMGVFVSARLFSF